MRPDKKNLESGPIGFLGQCAGDGRKRDYFLSRLDVAWVKTTVEALTLHALAWMTTVSSVR
jgi:hypothetical protein